MLEQTKAEKLYDTVQLAKEIFVRRAARYEYSESRHAWEEAQNCLTIAEIFLHEQEQYANQTKDQP